MERKSIHVIVTGKVQGVFFRDYTRKEAIYLGLTGWVQNLADGSVEAVLSGDAEIIGQMVTWLHRGSPMARVDKVQVEDHAAQESFSTFEIRY